MHRDAGASRPYALSACQCTQLQALNLRARAWQVHSYDFAKLLLPSLVNWLVPAYLMSRAVPKACSPTQFHHPA